MADRLDLAMVGRGLVRSRSQAQDLIRRGLVTVDGEIARKAGEATAPSATILVHSDESGMVSRGGVKLRAALDAFDFDPADRVILDIGASTGGFTQLLLERGARRVYAVDVGHGQLDATLVSDPRVVSLESFDARRLTRDSVEGNAIDAVVADLSFVSLSIALGPALALARARAWLVALVKPQFEVGREGIGKGGLVRDEALRLEAVADVAAWIASTGWTLCGNIQSPIAGGSGNIEYLVGAVRRA
jgi:23S rRNA (cytidine1920-2'-O)/16S rRNA (cytidine1409-2'-O)-methyltransferase